MRVQQVEVSTETKTSDNVTVSVTTKVQYCINPENVYEAYYKLQNPRQIMSAVVDDVVRSDLPSRTLDEAYENKQIMAKNVEDELSKEMAQYGLSVNKVLITALDPDPKVLAAMNEINTAKRLRAAAQDRAEADKLLKVKEAEADSESKHLSGIGVAKMRKAITSGFKESIEDMKESCGLNASQVVEMMLMTQYMDTLKDFAHSGKSSVMVPHTPAGMHDVQSQLRQGFITAQKLE
jgi:regulator of protease activity HflC (stomatin/prohibitin superfamily)